MLLAFRLGQSDLEARHNCFIIGIGFLNFRRNIYILSGVGIQLVDGVVIHDRHEITVLKAEMFDVCSAL